MDWKNIIAEIQRHGKLTQPQIAEKCGCGQATVGDLARGNTEQPRHSLGEALLALLKEVQAKVQPLGKSSTGATAEAFPELAQAPAIIDNQAIESVAPPVAQIIGVQRRQGGRREKFLMAKGGANV